jgi:chromosomal replication initiation ATPase DnaA
MRRELKSKFPQNIEIKDIVTKVCRHCGVNPEELRLKTRTARIVNARSSSVISQPVKLVAAVLRAADR